MNSDAPLLNRSLQCIIPSAPIRRSVLQFRLEVRTPQA
jgi:hypothetical protein